MKMKTRKTVITLSLLGLSALLSPAIMAADVTDGSNILAAAQSATTPSEHEAVAKYYEDAAKAMRAKMQEQQQLLEHYQDKSYLYGKKAQDLQAHTEALVRKYENAARTDATEAASHRQIASKLRDKERRYAETRSQRLSAIDGSHVSKVSRE